MIVADRKSLEEILDMIKPYNKILVVGCKGCVTVCNVGGAKEAGVLAASLKIGRKKENNPIEIDEKTIERQCDPEYIEQLRDIHDQYDAVLSMACGVGPQFLSEAYPGQKFFSGGQHQVFRRRGPAWHMGRALRRVRNLCHP